MKKNRPTLKLRKLFVILEISFILILLLIWISFESIRRSKNLWILFFYSFPSQFLISTVPNEPVFLYFSKFHSPLIVTFVAAIGAILTESLNYSVIKYFAEFRSFERVNQNKLIDKIVKLFNVVPFVALLIAGFTPVPFYPFRFLVVLADYPLSKFILAVFLSRTPRYFLLAYLSHIYRIPDYLLVVIFVALGMTFGIPLLKNHFREKGKENLI